MIKKIIFGFAVLFGSIACACAQEASPDEAIRVVKQHVDYDVNGDGTATITVEEAKSPLQQQVISALGQQTIGYQEGMHELEILEAYTLKKDGRRIDVPADRIVTQVPPGFADTPLYNDMKVKRIVFSDVEVGDQVVSRYKIRIITPQIPGQFFGTQLFPKSVRFDDARITLKHPKSFALQFHNRGLTEQATQQKDGFITHEWRYSNQEAIPEAPNAVDPYDRDPVLEVSSFKNWGEVAKAYDTRAKDKAAVTPEVRKLADDITKDTSGKRQQTEAIYAWVAKNIRYVAIYLGSGGLVPHAADAILTNRYGDCKDHVTILEALLKAKGIDSEAVLISQSNSFALPGVPTFAFNHAITYIPEFKLYLDATSRTLPFGILAVNEAGKPVIHTRYFKDVAHTPAIQPNTQSVVSNSTMTVTNEGTMKGTATLTATGPIRADVQGLVDQLDRPLVVKQITNRLLNRDGITGTAALSKVAAAAPPSTTSYKSEFSTPNWINMPGPGAATIPTALMSIISLQKVAIDTLNRPLAKVDRVCPPFDIEENSTVQLPDNIKLGAVPKNVDAANAMASYNAHYVRDGNAIKVSRKLSTKFPNPTCKPDQIAAYREIMEQVRRDTSAQMTYE